MRNLSAGAGSTARVATTVILLTPSIVGERDYLETCNVSTRLVHEYDYNCFGEFSFFVVSKVSKWNNVVGMLQATQQKYQGLNLDRNKKFRLLHRVQTGSGADPGSCTRGIGGFLFLGMNQLKWEVDLLPLYNDEVKNVWSYTSASHTSS
jgi:hypothetical protein